MSFNGGWFDTNFKHEEVSVYDNNTIYRNSDKYGLSVTLFKWRRCTWAIHL